MRRRPSRRDSDEDSREDMDNWVSAGVAEEMAAEPMRMPGFEDVPGMEGMFPEDRVTGQGEFFSRSAGYLSFVDGSFSKDDLAREMGVTRHRDDAPVTARDFPDLSAAGSAGLDMARQLAGGADLSEAGDYKELFPRGLPRDYEQYYPLRLHGCDYFISRMNDGRLNLGEVLFARRREDGNFAGEAERVNTQHLLQLDPVPAYFHEVAWTERLLEKKEKYSSNGGPADFDTMHEKTTKVYMVWAQNAPDRATNYDRKLDFTKPVILLDNKGAVTVSVIEGAAQNPGGVLVIMDGKMYVQAAEDLPNWETVCTQWDWEQAQKKKDGKGPDLHADFLTENEIDNVPDDTPDVDNI
mmetsp:Transcript_37039/g.91539  ORF Transcript_37039/g.91539 Transcript_37039/m.91539 type:complete len:353 (-) Transcript_37039:90-1148(-)